MDVRDLRRVIRAFPRYTLRKGYTRYGVSGVQTCFDIHVISRTEVKRITKSLAKYRDGYGRTDCSRSRLDPSKLVGLHRGLLIAKLLKLSTPARLSRWQVPSPRYQLPLIVIDKGRFIVWNGHHRSLICRLLGVPMLCDVFDLDAAKVKVKTP